MSGAQAHGNYIWTDERVAELRRLVGLGKSGSQIAMALRTGRNSVIGKVSRLGLTLKGGAGSAAKTVCRTGGSKAHGRASPVTIAATPYVERLEEAGTLTMLDLGAHHCRFPVGDPQADSFRFCGAGKLETSPYCARHHAITHTKPAPPPPKAVADPPRRRRAA